MAKIRHQQLKWLTLFILGGFFTTAEAALFKSKKHHETQLMNPSDTEAANALDYLNIYPR